MAELKGLQFRHNSLRWLHEHPQTLYRLLDEFTLFHIRWRKKQHWQTFRGKPSWQSWAGYAFENLCFRHRDKLKDALGIAQVQNQFRLLASSRQARTRRGARRANRSVNRPRRRHHQSLRDEIFRRRVRDHQGRGKESTGETIGLPAHQQNPEDHCSDTRHCRWGEGQHSR